MKVEWLKNQFVSICQRPHFNNERTKEIQIQILNITNLFKICISISLEGYRYINKDISYMIKEQ